MQFRILGRAAVAFSLSMSVIAISAEAEVRSSGSGFMINGQGDLITNNHVVSYIYKDSKTGNNRVGICSKLEILGGDYEGEVKIVGRDQYNDLAVLRLINNTARPGASGGGDPSGSAGKGQWRSLGSELGAKNSDGVARSSGSNNRTGSPSSGGRGAFASISTGDLRPGEPVIAVGFPFSFMLSSQPKVVTGVLAATVGHDHNVSILQHTAPINPGNSGGPLFDASGHVIGVNVSQLSSAQAQNVNFAVKAATTMALLDSLNVPYRSVRRGREMRTEEIMARATRYTVKISCHF